ncbi:MAG: HupE/UreJ family protein [Verrucomicrobia bacterium]|nr:HupE/UreJ family protein [Verrucomicrobiota bacterium]MCH8529117.1 HupE/UreJ family protein [Kiritimatiellia bacterium]
MNMLNTFLMLGHAAHGGEGGFWSGMSHPVTGQDHLLAMVAVGLLAVHGSGGESGRVDWRLPLAFLAGMFAGGVLGLFPVLEEPFELGIVLSVTFFGVLLLVASPRLHLLLPGLIAGFALFHGHAHVLEGPDGGALWSYAAGFLAGTAALLGAGVLAGLILLEIPRARVWGIRLAGAGAVVMSLVFLFE